MSSTANEAKWAGKLLLHIPLFYFLWLMATGLIHGSSHVFPENEGALLERLFTQHFLLVSILAGLAAGLFVRYMCRSTGLLTASANHSNSPHWREPQAWVWIIFVCIFLLGIVLWIEENRNNSVLVTSYGIWASGLIRGFFDSSCSFPTNKPPYFAGNCMYEGLFTNTLLGAVGYSAAIFLPTGLSRTFKNLRRNPVTGDNQVTLDQPSGSEPRHNNL